MFLMDISAQTKQQQHELNQIYPDDCAQLGSAQLLMQHQPNNERHEYNQYNNIIYHYAKHNKHRNHYNSHSREYQQHRYSSSNANNDLIFPISFDASDEQPAQPISKTAPGPLVQSVCITTNNSTTANKPSDYNDRSIFKSTSEAAKGIGRIDVQLIGQHDRKHNKLHELGGGHEFNRGVVPFASQEFLGTSLDRLARAINPDSHGHVDEDDDDEDEDDDDHDEDHNDDCDADDDDDNNNKKNNSDDYDPNAGATHVAHHNGSDNCFNVAMPSSKQQLHKPQPTGGYLAENVQSFYRAPSSPTSIGDDESFVASSGASLSSASFSASCDDDDDDYDDYEYGGIVYDHERSSTTTREDSGVLDMKDLDIHINCPLDADCRAANQFGAQETNDTALDDDDNFNHQIHKPQVDKTNSAAPAQVTTTSPDSFGAQTNDQHDSCRPGLGKQISLDSVNDDMAMNLINAEYAQISTHSKQNNINIDSHKPTGKCNYHQSNIHNTYGRSTLIQQQQQNNKNNHHHYHHHHHHSRFGQSGKPRSISASLPIQVPPRQLKKDMDKFDLISLLFHMI